MMVKGGIVVAVIHTTVTFGLLMDLNKGWCPHDFCAHTQEWEGVSVPRTERHAHLFDVRTRMCECLRQFWVFITRENASLTSLARSIIMNSIW